MPLPYLEFDDIAVDDAETSARLHGGIYAAERLALAWIDLGGEA